MPKKNTAAKEAPFKTAMVTRKRYKQLKQKNQTKLIFALVPLPGNPSTSTKSQKAIC